MVARCRCCVCAPSAPCFKRHTHSCSCWDLAGVVSLPAQLWTPAYLKVGAELFLQASWCCRGEGCSFTAASSRGRVVVPALPEFTAVKWRLPCRSNDGGNSADPPCVVRDMPHLHDALESDMPPPTSYVVTVCPTGGGACLTAICPTIDCSVPGMTPGVDYTTSAVATVQNSKHVGDVQLGGMLMNPTSPSFSIVPALAALAVALVLAAIAAAMLTWQWHRRGPSLMQRRSSSSLSRHMLREISGDGDLYKEGLPLVQKPELPTSGAQMRPLDGIAMFTSRGHRDEQLNKMYDLNLIHSKIPLQALLHHPVSEEIHTALTCWSASVATPMDTCFARQDAAVDLAVPRPLDSLNGPPCNDEPGNNSLAVRQWALASGRLLPPEAIEVNL